MGVGRLELLKGIWVIGRFVMQWEEHGSSNASKCLDHETRQSAWIMKRVKPAVLHLAN